MFSSPTVMASRETHLRDEPLALPSTSGIPPPQPTNDSDIVHTVKLDHLGPLVVNSDGTLSRIANWASMAESEKERTLRILSKRNMLRQEKLKSEEGETGHEKLS